LKSLTLFKFISYSNDTPRSHRKQNESQVSERVNIRDKNNTTQQPKQPR